MMKTFVIQDILQEQCCSSASPQGFGPSGTVGLLTLGAGVRRFIIDLQSIDAAQVRIWSDGDLSMKHALMKLLLWKTTGVLGD